MPRPAPLRAGDLQFRGTVQQDVSGAWTDYTGLWFDLESLSEGESMKFHTLTAPWTEKLAVLIGLRTLDEGYRVAFHWQGAERVLLIKEIIDPTNRRTEVRMQCQEVEP